MAVSGDGKYTPGGDGKPKRKKGYDWGDGKGRVHSRPKRNRPAAKVPSKLDDPSYFAGPMTLRTALAEAERAGQLQYGTAQSQLGVQQAQVPAWFDQYRQQLQTPAQVGQTYQPLVAQQQQVAQQTGQTLGLTGEAGEQDKLAAAARAALANSAAGVLQANQAADTTYFQGRAPVAQAAQIGLQSQLAAQGQQLARERGAYQDQYLTDARSRERAYGIDLQHQANENKAFGLDVAKLQADIQGDAASRKQKSRENRQKARQKGAEVNKYGYSNEQWARFSPSHRQRIMRQQDQAGAAKPKAKYTPQQTSKSNTDLRKSVALVQQGRKTPAGGAPEYWEKAYDQLVLDGVDPAMARAAVQLVRRGKVGPKTRKILKEDYGITRFPRGAKRKKPPGTSSGGGGGPHGTGRP